MSVEAAGVFNVNTSFGDAEVSVAYTLRIASVMFVRINCKQRLPDSFVFLFGLLPNGVSAPLSTYI